MHLCNWYQFYHIGAIAISVIPLLADYISQKSRGTCAAFLVFMSSLGAISSAYINFTILDKVAVDKKIYIQYGIISILILIIGVIYTCFCLKKGNTYYHSGRIINKKSVKEMLQIAK
jgi:MFS family permease